MQEDNKPSKHQLKKERMAARKAARKNKGGTNNSMTSINIYVCVYEFFFCFTPPHGLCSRGGSLQTPAISIST